MDRLMAGERAANSGWNGALEFEGTQSIANSVWTWRDTEKKQSRVLARARLAQQHNIRTSYHQNIITSEHHK